jgi:hypothetical protein
VFFLDDLQNITNISKADLALNIRDQFQAFGIDGLNYSVCFSGKPDYFTETKGLAEPAARFYNKVYLSPFSYQETEEYVRSTFGELPNSLHAGSSRIGCTKRPSDTHTSSHSFADS